MSDTYMKQDMPPPGGYPKIYYQRTFPKTFVNWWMMGAFSVGSFIYGAYIFNYGKRKAWGWEIEHQDTVNALQPFVKAESDRLWLLMMHRMRDEENEAMKDVPGWKTGTWYGEPIYFTIPKGSWHCPTETELYNHSRMYEYRWAKNWRRWVDSYNLPFWYDKYMPHDFWEDFK